MKGVQKMNRRERRLLERQGKLPKAEPVYNMKPSDMKSALLDGPAKAIVKKELNQKILDLDKQFTLDIDTMVLWTLHSRYGWGKKRLKQFYMNMFEEHLAMRARYEVGEMYPERQKLKEAGVDVETWFSSLFDDEGNFKRPEDIRL